MRNSTAILAIALAAGLGLSSCVTSTGGAKAQNPKPAEIARLPPLPPLPAAETEAVLGAITSALGLKPGEFVHVNPELKPASFQQDPYVDLGQLEDSTARDFEKKLGQRCLFPRNYPYPAETEIDWTGEVGRYLGEGGGGWGEYYREHPGSKGFVELSRAGMSESGNQALVYLGRQSHWVEGGGKLLLLQRQSGGWKVVDEVVLWGS